MARFSLIPREHKFFEDFIAMASEIRVGARVLDEMLSEQPPAWHRADDLKDIEHKCDHLTHEILKRLNLTFVTPLDREDIYVLARALDDVMDAIDAAGGYLRLYKVMSDRPGARELSAIIVQSTEEIHRGMQQLEKRDGVMKSVVEINRLENEADQLHSASIGRLFEQETNALEVIKWKEILNLLEEATDRCEDVANVLESVVVKYA